MRLYAGRVATIAEDIVKKLRDQEVIEVSLELVPEAELDVQSVLREYIRVERDINNKARELSDKGYGSFGRNKKQLIRQASFRSGEEGIDYIVDQLIEVFLHSHNIEEIYADDLELRKAISPIIKEHTLDADKAVDQQVRDQIKNLKEGGVSWDSEYDRVLGQLRRQKKI